MRLKNITSALLSLIVLFSCTKIATQELDDKENTATLKSKVRINNLVGAKLGATGTENFETGTKTAYTAATVTLSSGVWNFSDALIGNSASDRKNGTQSARVRNSGTLTMNFDVTDGAGTVTIAHALYGTDVSGTWQLWYSTNGGTSYTQSGSTISTNSTTLSTTTFTINVAGNVRLDIRKTDGSTNRINFDDVTITPYSGTIVAPTLTSISPNTISAGSAAFTLTATGSNFINTSTIDWNGTALTTTFVSGTSLTAIIPAANIAATGTNLVTVNTTGVGISSSQTFTVTQASSGPKKFLFDASQGETAGNADWVIDEDNSNPQRFPTPAQSNVTATTAETFWTGAISAWGISLAKLGHTVETLPSSGSITYGSTTNAQDLSNYNVFVVDEPNIRFTTAEKQAILNFVNNGGGLLMIADHTVSDRNNDGWDSPDIWNDFMTNNGLVTNPFGFSVDLTNFSQVTSNVKTSSSSNVILNGSQGAVTQMEFNNGASVTLSPTANATVQGLIWKSGVTQNNSNVMAASSTYGTGRIFIVTDSSPIDDGTGAPNNTLFNGWGVYSHKKLFMNASLWLAKLQ